MKILIVNTFDISGGAARAAYRLHKSLLASNIHSRMLVQDKISDDYTVIGANSKVEKIMNKLRFTIDSLPVRFYKNRKKTLFSPSWFGFNSIVDKINEINPDIVHIHWICGGMIKIEEMAKIKAPIIWSLHDNWAFTGGCHIKWECEKYIESCGACPVLGSNKVNDLSKKTYNRKQKIFSTIDNMTIVGLSNWVNECSKTSSLLNDKRHVNLPNPIDANIFKPFDKQISRKLWNLPIDTKLVLFGSNSATSDINKGFKELSEALHKLTEKNIELVVYGSSKPKNSQNFGFTTHYLGYLHDDVSLVTLYSAADVMVVPSIQENLSNTIMESLSCAIPVVAFDIGGNSDMIEHKKNGYLSKSFDTTDLKNGIEWVLNSENYDELCKNARDKVLRKFDNSVVSQQYIELYKKVMISD